MIYYVDENGYSAVDSDSRLIIICRGIVGGIIAVLSAVIR